MIHVIKAQCTETLGASYAVCMTLLLIAPYDTSRKKKRETRLVLRSWLAMLFQCTCLGPHLLLCKIRQNRAATTKAWQCLAQRMPSCVILQYSSQSTSLNSSFSCCASRAASAFLCVEVEDWLPSGGDQTSATALLASASS